MMAFINEEDTFEYEKRVFRVNAVDCGMSLEELCNLIDFETCDFLKNDASTQYVLQSILDVMEIETEPSKKLLDKKMQNCLKIFLEKNKNRLEKYQDIIQKILERL